MTGAVAAMSRRIMQRRKRHFDRICFEFMVECMICIFGFYQGMAGHGNPIGPACYIPLAVKGKPVSRPYGSVPAVSLIDGLIPGKTSRPARPHFATGRMVRHYPPQLVAAYRAG
jgi:hypothetical protein